MDHFFLDFWFKKPAMLLKDQRSFAFLAPTHVFCADGNRVASVFKYVLVLLLASWWNNINMQIVSNCDDTLNANVECSSISTITPRSKTNK